MTKHTSDAHSSTKIIGIAFALLLIVVAVLIANRDRVSTWFAPGPVENSASTETAEYTCSMHPSVRKHEPGQCPICGMDLARVSDSGERADFVTIAPAQRQLIGVRTSIVKKSPMVQSLHAIGRITYDESKLSDVSLKVRGWIMELFVSNTGQRVRKGQTMFTLYSPELYNAQQDFLLAATGGMAGAGSSGHGRALVQAARQRLRLLDLSESQIDAIEKRGEPLENVPFVARESGFVIEKNVVEGAAIEPAMRLYRIAGLDEVWIDADIYEADFARVQVGQAAKVTLDYLPGQTYEARVAYVYPYLNAEARTGRVRLELNNDKREFRPGMYANVQLEAELGPRLQVPSSAIVYTGPRRLVFVDMGGGRFRPQEVTVGSEANGMYEVVSGVNAGDVVASSGVFLIAAEARIRTAAQYWEGTEAGEIGAASTGTTPPPSPERVLAAPKPRAGAHSHVAHPPPSAANLERAAPQPPGYTCPMHPDVHSDGPGRCPKCGMNLVLEKTGDKR